MKANTFSPFHRSIAILLCFILMTELTGCIAYRAIPKSDLPDYTIRQHSVIGKISTYSLDSTEISDSILKGFLAPDQSRSRKYVKIYAMSDTLIKIDGKNLLYLPMNGIDKVMVPKDYIPIEYNYTGSSKKVHHERQPAGKEILTFLYYIAGFSVIGSLSWMIFQNKRQ